MASNRITYHNFSLHEYEKTMTNIRQEIDRQCGHNKGLFDIAVSEAIINGIVHSDPVSLQNFGVYVTLHKTRTKLISRIKDHGRGFNGNERLALFKKNRDKIIADMLMEETGRGLLIMLEASDYLVYNKTGNEVLLMKKI